MFITDVGVTTETSIEVLHPAYYVYSPPTDTNTELNTRLLFLVNHKLPKHQHVSNLNEADILHSFNSFTS